jgi:lysophospholipase L1-like esterase
LFRPDRELQAIAESEGIPFLSMGQLMYDKNLASDEIKAFYFSDGTGHLTPAGHQFLAEAIYSCFYSENDTCAE